MVEAESIVIRGRFDQLSKSKRLYVVIELI